MLAIVSLLVIVAVITLLWPSDRSQQSQRLAVQLSHNAAEQRMANDQQERLLRLQPGQRIMHGSTTYTVLGRMRLSDRMWPDEWQFLLSDGSDTMHRLDVIKTNSGRYPVYLSAIVDWNGPAPDPSAKHKTTVAWQGQTYRQLLFGADYYYDPSDAPDQPLGNRRYLLFAPQLGDAWTPGSAVSSRLMFEQFDDGPWLTTLGCSTKPLDVAILP